MTQPTADRVPFAAEGPPLGRPLSGWRLGLYTVIFEADTRAGRLFDLAVIAAILLSVLVVLADSVQALHHRYAPWFSAIEWGFTLLFTAEYLARLACVQRPWRYATSFFGVVDLLAVLPTYLALLVPVAGALIDVRILRLLRVFRILRLTRYVQEFSALADALRASRRKILVFLSFVMMMVLVCGTVMYVVEGPANGYTSIPTAMYWAISTMTTVGFGDIAPKTDVGRAIASLMMLLGWGVLAVPTGIVTAEMTWQRRGLGPATTRTCHACLSEGHAADARYCSQCGERLPAYQRDPA
ncbi:MAG: ion transporter [Burkholderiaceae bacterium]